RPASGCGGAGLASDSTRRGFGRVEGTRRRAAEGGTFGETEVAPGADGAFDFTATGGLASGASRRTGEGDDGILDGPGGVIAGLSRGIGLTGASCEDFLGSRTTSSTLTNCPSVSGLCQP